MGIVDIFGVYFELMSLQPVISQRVLEWKRTGLLRKLEKQSGSRVMN